MTETRSLFVATLLLAATFSADAAAETMVGRWCDRSIPNLPVGDRIMTIVVRDNGNVDVVSTFRNSAPLVQRLREQRGSVYSIVGSSSGDRMRITAPGNLQLLDNDGLIREANRLENTPRPRECLR